MRLLVLSLLIWQCAGVANIGGFGVNRLKSRKDTFTEKVTQVHRHYQQVRDHKHFVSVSDSSDDCLPVRSLYYNGSVLDNFASTDDQIPWTGSQRYWINEELWGGPGYPVFVFIGGEWEESCYSLKNGSMYIYDLAEEHQGLLVDVEHRFYGKSFPTDDTSLDSLEYLTSEQALADLARLLTYVMETYNTTSSKVITVGGSYSGNLAAWFRLKYPSITTGSIASSGPLTAEINFLEYMQVVAESINYYSGSDCNNALQVAAETLLTKNRTDLRTDFKTCGPVVGNDDITILMSNLMGNIQGVVQYNNPNDGSFNINDMCDIMLNGIHNQRS